MQLKQLTNGSGKYLITVDVSITRAEVDSRRATFSLIGVCATQFPSLLKSLAKFVAGKCTSVRRCHLSGKLRFF